MYFMALWIFGSPIIDHTFFGGTNGAASGKENPHHSHTHFSPFEKVEGKGQIPNPEIPFSTAQIVGNSQTTILAAGDIAKCDNEDSWKVKFLKLVKLIPDEGPSEPFLENFLELLSISEETDYPSNAALTANLILHLSGRVLALGDLVYPAGTDQQFQECYESTWGQFKSRTHPVPGNHEYREKGAAPYFAYWGRQAGSDKRGFYSFDLGEWHIIALNSPSERKEGKDTISAQQTWLKKDLSATNNRCILAYWHHPVFSSGQHGGTERMKHILEILYEAGVSVVLTGHDHHYERFAPQNPSGSIDPLRGFRNFVIGTGGRSLRPLKKRHENSEVFRADTFGVLRLDLYSNYYTWQFLPVKEEKPSDMGAGICVNTSGPETL